MGEEPNKSSKKLSSTQIILIVGMAIILAAVVGIGFLLLNKKQEAPAAAVADPGSGNLVVDDQFDADAMNRKAADNMFEVKMSNPWTFLNGTSPSSDSYVANSAANHGPFYFELVLNPDTEEEEIIYKSPVVPLGSAVRDITLTKALEAGQYDCTCRYYLLNDDKTIRSTIGIAVQVIVQQ